MIKQTFLFFAAILTGLSAMAQQRDWLTFYEKSGYLETPRYEEVLDYCKQLSRRSKMVSYSTFGQSAQGREMPLLILDRDGLATPEAIRAAGRIVLLLQACIHPGESDGKDAGLVLFRDFAFPQAGSENRQPDPEILNHVSIVFIPIFNVDGHERFGQYNRINQNGPKEMGWRTTANNLNLNRDFLKADAPEMIAWLELFNNWLPEFFIDTHTTDGADYQYALTYLMEIYGNMDAGLTGWAKKTFVPQMEKNMVSKGIPVFPYVDFRNWHDPRSGLITEVAPPMLSQGYTALRNRPGMLIETHMLKPYRQRVNATCECILASLEILSREAQTLKTLISAADKNVSSLAFIKTPFPMLFETRMNDSVMVDFLGFDYKSVKSEISGGDWFQYSKKPVTFKLPYFSSTIPVVTAQLPYAYVIPAEWKTVIERIRAHGIIVTELTTGATVPVATCRFKNPKWQQNPYEGRHPMTNIAYDDIEETRFFPAGSVVVEVMQPAGRIIPHLLEPKGNGSFLYWGFFDAIFEQKEYAESYVIEKMARTMMKEDPALQREFEEKKNNDTAFAKNQRDIINWFYNKSPYADTRKGIFPIGKIFNEQTLRELLQK